MSFADETGTEVNDYLYSYPPSVRRALDILSICHRKLFGTRNSYNRSFALSAYEYLENNNLGKEIEIEDGTFIAGNPIVTYETFSEKYKLITNTIVQNYNSGDNVPLSSVNYNWGWELVTGTKEQSGVEIKDYYKFYEYVPNKKLDIRDNVRPVDEFNMIFTIFNKSWSVMMLFIQTIVELHMINGIFIIFLIKL
jgi:hypothetical protein